MTNELTGHNQVHQCIVKELIMINQLFYGLACRFLFINNTRNNMLTSFKCIRHAHSRIIQKFEYGGFIHSRSWIYHFYSLTKLNVIYSEEQRCWAKITN